MSSLTGPSRLPSGGRKVRSVLVLLHGVGADGNDLIGLTPFIERRLPDTAIYAPDAPEPCDMAPFGRQWFSLQDRRPEALARGPARSAPLLSKFIDELLKRHTLPSSKLALLGFSQGTMMALSVGPRHADPLAAVLGYSGALVDGANLAQEARSRPPVMLVHGDADEIVPVQALFAAVAALQAADIPAQWLQRPGVGHSIDPAGLESGLDFLRSALA